MCSLSIPHDMHLVVPTHPYFFWVVCHPSRTFFPKELEQEPQNRFFLSPHCQAMSSLTSDHDPPLPILTGYRLVVSGSCTYFTFFACCSCICRDLEIGLYILPCTFSFIWCGLFSNLPFFMTCFFFRVGPCRIMSLPSLGLLCIHYVALLAFPTISLCYSCCNVV